jgi:hypothetical protein
MYPIFLSLDDLLFQNLIILLFFFLIWVLRHTDTVKVIWRRSSFTGGGRPQVPLCAFFSGTNHFAIKGNDNKILMTEFKIDPIFSSNNNFHNSNYIKDIIGSNICMILYFYLNGSDISIISRLKLNVSDIDITIILIRLKLKGSDISFNSIRFKLKGSDISFNSIKLKQKGSKFLLI